MPGDVKMEAIVHRSLYVNEILMLKIASCGFNSLPILFQYPAGVSRFSF